MAYRVCRRTVRVTDPSVAVGHPPEQIAVGERNFILRVHQGRSNDGEKGIGLIIGYERFKIEQRGGIHV